MMKWSWLNPKRLRDYPRLVLITCSAVLLLNFLLRHGWIGGLTNYLLWGDFIIYYAAGQLYINDIPHLYDYKTQETVQLSLIGSSKPIGLSFYSYPPNAAFLHSTFTYIPLPVAIALWCLLSITCVILAAWLMKRYLILDWMIDKGISTLQLSILIMSSFAFIEGFEKGQSQSLTLILIVAILITTQREKWLLSGFLAALSIFKPQFVIGFLILWIIWGKYKAILSFIFFSSIWNGIVLITKGIGPYLAFLDFSNQMIYLPYSTAGFPNSIMATPFTLIATVIPMNYAPVWNKLFIIIAIILVILFAALVFLTRKKPMANQNIILAMALLLPLIAFPYALLHDLLILAPVLVLLAAPQEQGNKIKYLTVGVYIGMLVLPLLGFVFNIALTAFIPIILYIYCVQQSIRLLRT